ncbi:hypothetical protein MVEN_00112500 [Mycena venus]|uniref:Uncharacterized protein n=1 Tax=Mycena venus TaxID=2733690 RepID=A0A8H7DIF9_9AGAR|nr:hypothetical protein MVEN_00112500 [Mycena venus]
MRRKTLNGRFLYPSLAATVRSRRTCVSSPSLLPPASVGRVMAQHRCRRLGWYCKGDGAAASGVCATHLSQLNAHPRSDAYHSGLRTKPKDTLRAHMPYRA